MKKIFVMISVIAILSNTLSSCGGKADKAKETKEEKTSEVTSDKSAEKTSEKKEDDSLKPDVEETSNQAEMAVVTAKSGLTMRTKPSMKAKVIDLIPANGVVEILEKGEVITLKGKESNWYKVRFDDEEGYCFGGFLRMGNQLEATSDTKTNTSENEHNTDMGGGLQKALINAESGLTLRQKPSPKGTSITTIPNKEEIVVLEFLEKSSTIAGKTGNWCKIRFKNKEGYIFSPYLNFSTATVSAKSGLTLREEPSKEGKKITVIPFDKEVYLLAEDPIVDEETGTTWFKVIYGKKEGYASAEFLEIYGC
jgi:uncharacterized protein YgiM (DUF1202 family)